MLLKSNFAEPIHLLLQANDYGLRIPSRIQSFRL